MACQLCRHVIDAWKRSSNRGRCFGILILFFLLGTIVFVVGSLGSIISQVQVKTSAKSINSTAPNRPDPRTEVVEREEIALTGALECFQVDRPILTPSGAPGFGSPSQGSCQVVLMDHVFGSTYGVPFVGMLQHAFKRDPWFYDL